MTTATDLAEAQSKLPIRRMQRPRLSQPKAQGILRHPDQCLDYAGLSLDPLARPQRSLWLARPSRRHERRGRSSQGGSRCVLALFRREAQVHGFWDLSLRRAVAVALAMILFIGMIGVSMIPRFWTRTSLVLWAATIAVTGLLISGGAFGLSYAHHPMERPSPIVSLVCRWPRTGLPLGDCPGSRSCLKASGDPRPGCGFHRGDPWRSPDQHSVHGLGHAPAVHAERDHRR